jgi:hypothetical protein
MLPDLAHGDRIGDPEVGVHVLVIPGKITKIFSFLVLFNKNFSILNYLVSSVRSPLKDNR